VFRIAAFIVVEFDASTLIVGVCGSNRRSNENRKYRVCISGQFCSCCRGCLDSSLLSMTTRQELTSRLNDIDATLASGVQSTTVDGETTMLNHETLRLERRLILEKLGRVRKRRRTWKWNMNGR
jgi:hypothetical protein